MTEHQSPIVMGIVNASPDSFSGNSVTDASVIELVTAMVAGGAGALDLGAQSLRTDRPEISLDEELGRLIPVLVAIRSHFPDVVLSVDTYRAEVARRAIEGGASIVNDASGLYDGELAEVVAGADVDLVLTYNRSRPKQRLTPDELATDVVADCLEVMSAKVAALQARGIDTDRIIFDPGVDLGKSPRQSIEIIRNTEAIRSELGLSRVLWALSRKDFVGALTSTLPSERDAATLGALSYPRFHAGDLVRVHDVAAVTNFFTVRDALCNGFDQEIELPVALRHG